MGEDVERQLERAEARWFEHWLRGPTRPRLEALPVQVGDAAPDVDLIDSNEDPVRLSGFWAEAPLHLFFMRHFGCSCMKDRWAQLQDHIPTLREAGAQTVAIGLGEPARTRRYKEMRRIDVPVLCDPERAAYEAYGIAEGTVASILHDDEWRQGDEETGRRLMESRRETDLRLADNPWTLPGEFVIGRDGVIRHVHRYQYCEDYPPVAVLVGAVRAAG